MSQEPNRKRWPKKLVVEGKDDLYVIANIRDKYQLEDNFEIIDAKGVDKVPDVLLSQIKAKQAVVGIVIDADDKIDTRWNSLRTVLVAQDYVVPEKPDTNGTILPATGRNPKIGIWLMPDNRQEPGMLEHFVATLIPDDDLLKPQAQEILDKLEINNLNKYSAIHKSKALIHTWLAWQADPGTPMGLAITKTYLNHNTELCQRFAHWLIRLFAE